jgi:hypothetical protein
MFRAKIALILIPFFTKKSTKCVLSLIKPVWLLQLQLFYLLIKANKAQVDLLRF